jgi:hypothetical protein
VTDRIRSLEDAAALARGGNVCRVVSEPGYYSERPDPHIIPRESGYGGAGVLNTGVRQTGVQVVGHGGQVAPPPAPMTSLTRHTRPDQPGEYGTDPQRASGVRVFGGSAQVSSGIGDALASLRAENAQLRAAVAALERRVGGIEAGSKKRDARPAARRRKPASRRPASKKG